MNEPQPEPWLRGPLEGVDPLLAPILHALTQASEDLRNHTRGLTDEQVWLRGEGVASLGFHLKHIAGSLDRLTTYLEGKALTEDQLGFLRTEEQPGTGLGALMLSLDSAIARTSNVIAALPIDSLRTPRTVGRKRLPTTVAGLAIHIAEHTQRHVGQAILLAKLSKAHDRN